MFADQCCKTFKKVEEDAIIMNKVQSIAVAAAMLLAIVGCRGNAFSNLSSAPSGNASSGASATAWTPIKDVKVIVAYRHGSGTDTSARLLLANAKSTSDSRS